MKRPGVEPPRPRLIASWRYAGWLAVAAVCFGAFMGQLDASIVTLTFPVLSQQFHSSLASVQWVSLSYLLTLVILLAPVGRMADVMGHKWFYLRGFLLFTVASAACGLAPSLPVLLGFRVLQAAGAAMLQANSIALVTTSVPPRRMRAALGVQAAAQAIGLALGPTLGGVLVDHLGWRWVFGINIPVGVLGMLAGWFLLPRTRRFAAVESFDWPGVVFLGVALAAALFAVSTLSGLALPYWVAAVLLVVAAVAGWGFVVRQRTASSPLIGMSILRVRAVSSGLLAALGGYCVLFGPLVLLPVELSSRGSSLTSVGLVLTALPAGFSVAAVLGGRLFPRSWSNRLRSIWGAVIVVVALVALATTPMTMPVVTPLLGLLGVGLGLFTPPNNAVVMNAVPSSAAGVGGGLVNMARGLGTSLGVAAVTFVLHETNSAKVVFLLLAVIGVGVAIAVGAAEANRYSDQDKAAA